MSSTNDTAYKRQLDESRQIWDAEAAAFDDQPDHGLRDPVIRAAWARLLEASLPSSASEILDIGCGTGSLSILLAGFGCNVTGIDFSPEMIHLAQTKAQAVQQSIQFHIMDAAFPQFPPQQFDAVICRHLLWALPEPRDVLQRWVRLLKPYGRLLLIEGFWHMGAGLRASEILAMLPASLINSSVQNLSDQPDLWGGEVLDERYIILANLQP